MELNKINFDQIQRDIGYNFKDIGLLKQALTHSSYANIKGVESYERLEYLGDKLLSAYVAKKLFKDFPNATEGELSKKESSLVKAEMQEIVLCRIQSLSESICHNVEKKVKKAEKKMKGQVLEAIIGAVYLDGGEGHMVRVIETLYKEEFRDMVITKKSKPKSKQVPTPVTAIKKIDKDKDKESKTADSSVQKVKFGRKNRRKLDELVRRIKGLQIKYRKYKNSDSLKFELTQIEGKKGVKIKKIIFETTEITKEQAAFKAVEFLLQRQQQPQPSLSRTR
jgi:ribonuclease-3